MPRKPMTEEQRAAAVERLAKAREARGHDGSKSVHENLRDMDKDSPIHWKKVKGWITEIQTELKSTKAKKTSKDRKERAEYINLEVYLSNLKKYIASGIYHDSRYGRHREGRMNTVVRTLAYHPDGFPKRTVGFYYPDLGGQVWTKEMDDEYKRSRSLERNRGRKQVSEQESV